MEMAKWTDESYTILQSVQQLTRLSYWEVSIAMRLFHHKGAEIFFCQNKKLD